MSSPNRACREDLRANGEGRDCEAPLLSSEREAVQTPRLEHLRKVVEKASPAALYRVLSAPALRDNNGWTSLHFSAYSGDLELASLLLERGADPNARTDHGLMTPLHTAVLGSRLEVVRLLLDCDTDLEARAWDGRTPLHYAIARGNTEVTRFLLERGADPEARADRWIQAYAPEQWA